MRVGEGPLRVLVHVHAVVFGHGLGLGHAPRGGQVIRRLRQEEPHQRDQDQGGQSTQEEHLAPAGGRGGGRPDGQQRGQHGAHVVAGHHQGGGVGALPVAGELGDHGDGRGQAAAQPHAGQEPQQAHCEAVLGEAGDEGEHGEGDHRADQQLAPAEPVRGPAHAERTDHHADQSGRGDHGPGGVVDPHGGVLGQLGHDGAQDHGVEAVHQHGQPAQWCDPAATAQDQVRGAAGRSRSRWCGHTDALPDRGVTAA